MKRVRFSLLSLLVGVVLAGGVVWLNVRPVDAYITVKYAYTNGKSTSGVLAEEHYGWPIPVYECPHPSDGPYPIAGGGGLFRLHGDEPSLPGLAANIAIGLAIVFGGAGVCEWVVRRRAKAKE